MHKDGIGAVKSPTFGDHAFIDNVIISDLCGLMLCTLCKTPEIFVKMTSVMTQFDIFSIQGKKKTVKSDSEDVFNYCFTTNHHKMSVA